MSESLPLIVDDYQFESEVLAGDGLVLVGLWGTWSGACHIMTPVVESIARELDGRITVVLVDIDRASSIKHRYGIASVPALLFFRDGQLVAQVLGTMPKKTLAEKAVTLLAKTD